MLSKETLHNVPLLGEGKATIDTHTPEWLHTPKHNFVQVIFKFCLYNLNF